MKWNCDANKSATPVDDKWRTVFQPFPSFSCFRKPIVLCPLVNHFAKLRPQLNRCITNATAIHCPYLPLVLPCAVIRYGKYWKYCNACEMQELNQLLALNNSRAASEFIIFELHEHRFIGPYLTACHFRRCVAFRSVSREMD